MKPFILLLPLVILLSCYESTTDKDALTPSDPVAFSIRMLNRVRTSGKIAAELDSLDHSDLQILSGKLKDQNSKLAFWINVYNTLVQVNLKDSSLVFEDRDRFFNRKCFRICNEELSLNDIEDGMLRKKSGHKTRNLYSRLSVERPDPRIHFALNCGTVSCPPISFYTSEDVDTQLELAEKSFLKASTHYNAEKDQVTISSLFEWYENDFGGRQGIIERLKKHQLIPLFSEPDIRYSEYDWKLKNRNFSID